MISGRKRSVNSEEEKTPRGWLKTKDKCYPIYPDANTIGRHDLASVKLLDQTVSRQHALIIVLEENRILISDLKSSSGSKLNKRSLKPLKLYKLNNGDTLSFGNVSCTFTQMESCVMSLEETQVHDQSLFNANTQQIEPAHVEVDIHNMATQPIDELHFLPPNTRVINVDVHDMQTQLFAPSVHDELTQRHPVQNLNLSVKSDNNMNVSVISIRSSEGEQIETVDADNVAEEIILPNSPTDNASRLDLPETNSTNTTRLGLTNDGDDSAIRCSQIQPVRLCKKRTIESDDESTEEDITSIHDQLTQVTNPEDPNYSQADVDMYDSCITQSSEVRPIKLGKKQVIDSDNDDTREEEVAHSTSSIHELSTQIMNREPEAADDDDGSNDSINFMPNSVQITPVKQSERTLESKNENEITTASKFFVNTSVYSKELNDSSGSETDAEIEDDNLNNTTDQAADMESFITERGDDQSIIESVIEDSMLQPCDISNSCANSTIAENECNKSTDNGVAFSSFGKDTLKDSTHNSTFIDSVVENGNSKIDEQTIENLDDTQTAPLITQDLDIYCDQKNSKQTEETSRNEKDINKDLDDTETVGMISTQELNDLYASNKDEEGKERSEKEDSEKVGDKNPPALKEPINDDDILLQPTQPMNSCNISSVNPGDSDDDLFLQPTQVFDRGDHNNSNVNPGDSTKDDDIFLQPTQACDHVDHNNSNENYDIESTQPVDIQDDIPANKESPETNPDVPQKLLELMDNDKSAEIDYATKNESFACTQQLKDVLEGPVEIDYAGFQPTQALMLLNCEDNPDLDKRDTSFGGFAATQDLTDTLQGGVEDDLRKITAEWSDSDSNEPQEFGFAATQQLADLLDSPRLKKQGDLSCNKSGLNRKSSLREGKNLEENTSKSDASMRGKKKLAKTIESSDSETETNITKSGANTRSSQNGSKTIVSVSKEKTPKAEISTEFDDKPKDKECSPELKKSSKGKMKVTKLIDLSDSETDTNTTQSGAKTRSSQNGSKTLIVSASTGKTSKSKISTGFEADKSKDKNDSLEVKKSPKRGKKVTKLIDSSDSETEADTTKSGAKTRSLQNAPKTVTYSASKTKKLTKTEICTELDDNKSKDCDVSLEVKKSARGRKKITKLIDSSDSETDTSIKTRSSHNDSKTSIVSESKGKTTNKAEISTAFKDNESKDIDNSLEVKQSARGRKKVSKLIDSSDSETETTTTSGAKTRSSQNGSKALIVSASKENIPTKAETSIKFDDKMSKIEPSSSELKKSARGKKNVAKTINSSDSETESNTTKSTIRIENADSVRTTRKRAKAGRDDSFDSDFETPIKNSKPTNKQNVGSKVSTRGKNRNNDIATTAGKTNKRLVDSSDSESIVSSNVPSENESDQTTSSKGNKTTKQQIPKIVVTNTGGGTSEKITDPKEDKPVPTRGRRAAARKNKTLEVDLNDSIFNESTAVDNQMKPPTTTKKSRRNNKKSIDPDEISILRSTKKPPPVQIEETSGRSKRRLFRLSSSNMEMSPNNDEAERMLHKTILQTRTRRGATMEREEGPAVKARRLSANSRREQREATTPNSEENVPVLDRSRRPVRPKVIFTMIKKNDLDTLVRSLGGSVVDDINTATVLVTSEVKRSQKLLCAVAKGKPICSEQWLIACKKAYAFIDPWEHIIKDKEAEKKWDFSLEESIKRGKERQILLGYSFRIIVAAGADVVDVLKGVIDASGGKIVKSVPKNEDDKFFVISIPESKAKWPKARKDLIIIEPEAIFDGILRQHLRFDQHRLN